MRDLGIDKDHVGINSRTLCPPRTALQGNPVGKQRRTVGCCRVVAAIARVVPQPCPHSARCANAFNVCVRPGPEIAGDGAQVRLQVHVAEADLLSKRA
eukprot:15447418-Alexandrium_andersonii.AAC.1